MPESERENIIEAAHSHLGIQGCIRRMRESLYWPGMYKDVENFVSKCEICNSRCIDQPKEPLISHEVPDRPWSKLGCDLFDLNQKAYLVTVDYFSDYFEIDRLFDKTGKEVIGKLKAHFARHGIPDVIFSDNGPPFQSHEFDKFAESYDFEHITSSPAYPQSNGKVENAVKTSKRIMEKSIRDAKDPFLALLDWRNTPREGVNYSPSQRLFGRRTKTLLPTSTKLLEPQSLNSKDVKDKITQRKEKQQNNYNHGVKELGILKGGDVVRIKPVGRSKLWTKAVVTDQTDIRSYNVRTEDGREYRRNRRHLRKTQEKWKPVGTPVILGSDTDSSKPVVETPSESVNVAPDKQMELVTRETRDTSPKPSQIPVRVPSPTPSTPVTTRVGRRVEKPKHLQDFVCQISVH